MPHVRSAAVGFWLDCGSRDEQAALAGASHFLEHLLFKGTSRRSAQDIAEALEAVGGDLNAFTSREYTCFHARCLDEDLALAIDVLGDMVTSATNAPADVEAERNVVLEEIRMHLDTPDELVHSVFNEAYFGDHALGREVLGHVGTVGGMTRDEVHGYYRRWYVPANLVVAVAGNVAHEEVVGLVAGVVGAWDGGDGATGTRPPSPAGGRRRGEPARGPSGPSALVRPRPTEQAHIVVGGPGLARDDPRRFAASVLDQALGGGMSSRLFQEVRERRGLVYSVYSTQARYTDAGTFAVYAGTTPGRALEVLDVVRAELRRAADGGLTADELRRAKGHLAGSLLLALEDSGSRMVRLGKAVVTGTPLLGLDELLETIRGVSDADVADAGRVLLAEPTTLAVVGPFDDAAGRRPFEGWLADPVGA
ncbi:MAG: insulinase family protein [Actinobacteria bacterium]|nr:insulinase family protein [Actinomycetota bacterium]